MALEAGTKRVPYEVLSPLGSGGMSEVNLASAKLQHHHQETEGAGRRSRVAVTTLEGDSRV